MAVLLGDEAQRASWPESFLSRLREWGIRLVPLAEGRFMLSTFSNSTYGAVEFLGPEAGGARFSGEIWATMPSPCPFLDDLAILGFVAWEEWESDPAARQEWLIPLVKEGKGFIAEPGTGRYRSAVIELRASATGLLSKYGFEDGDIFLTRDENGRKGYRGALCRDMERTLAAHGLHTYVGGPEVTCHNLCRSYHGFFLDAARTIPLEDEDEIYRRLSDITVQFWGYDFTIEDDPMFKDDDEDEEARSTPLPETVEG
ncbi:hypothetical protein [Polyangium jinanense]|uniref:Uncharacterized protein n=1 Tax=Polyangium jinanense TaxID=2829994 RepID=A0A9X3X0N2_9BACT|nr:hypothetical protein [Polyangium jinanense]MDC3955283.1 hypothetical protein [Polyangium jinanense]MDC3981584.1 hypothetical protein [Polyangium jinanense]